MNLFEQISKDIVTAMKAKDKVRLGALRGAKKEFIEANTAIGAGAILADDAAILILQKMAKQRNDSATIFTQQGRADLAETELAELAVISEYLPKQLTNEELEAKIKDIIAKVGASTPADMGKVMGVASKELAGVTTGKAISDKVKELLSK